MNWRPWVYGVLTTNAGIGVLVPPSSVFGGGAIEESPDVRPFIVYRIQADNPLIKDAMVPIRSARAMSIWVYDEPGSYDKIDLIIDVLKSALIGQVALPGATACEWTGDSQELSDPIWKAIVRNTNFNLIGSNS